MLPALDAWELDGPQFAALFLIVAGDARDLVE